MDNRNFWIFSSRLVEWFYKGFGLFLKILLFLVGFYFLYGFFVPQAKEDAFLAKVSNTFIAHETDKIFVKNVTDFEWDRVCAFDNGLFDDPFSSFYFTLRGVPASDIDLGAFYAKHSGYERSVFDGHIPDGGWTYFKGAHLFFLNGQVVEKYIYRGWGSLTGFENNSNYVMLDYTSGDKHHCESKEDAIFKYKESPREGYLYGLYLTHVEQKK